MISKSVIVFWSVFCLTIFVHLIGKDGGGTAYYILFTGLFWAIIVIPTALIANVFKSQKVYSAKTQMIHSGVLAAIGLLTFMIVHSSQQPKPLQAQGKAIYQQSTGRGFQPWVER